MEVTDTLKQTYRRNASRKVRRPDCTLATVDHNVPYAYLLNRQ